MRDVIRGYSVGTPSIIEVLDGSIAATQPILGAAEVTATGIQGFAPGVGHQRAEAMGEPVLEPGFQGIVVSIANAAGIGGRGGHPGHLPELIYGKPAGISGCTIGAGHGSNVCCVGVAAINKAPAPAANIGG